MHQSTASSVFSSSRTASSSSRVPSRSSSIRNASTKLAFSRASDELRIHADAVGSISRCTFPPDNVGTHAEGHLGQHGLNRVSISVSARSRSGSASSPLDKKIEYDVVGVPVGRRMTSNSMTSVPRRVLVLKCPGMVFCSLAGLAEAEVVFGEVAGVFERSLGLAVLAALALVVGLGS